MVKRKREVHEDDGEDRAQSKKVHHAIKILTRALKIARSFEQRKLIRNGKHEDVDTLKSLDLNALAQHHVYKKLKLPTKYSTNNVTSRLFNTKPVKEALKGEGKLISSAKEDGPLRQNVQQLEPHVQESRQDIRSKGSAKETQPTVTETDLRNTTPKSLIAPLKAAQVKPKSSQRGVVETKDATFIPSLMAGYRSGSESAEEIEQAPRRNRRGQRARRQMWENRFGAHANHLKKSRNGVKVLQHLQRGGPQIRKIQSIDTTRSQATIERPVHPSWEAAKKQREQPTAFVGKKLVFD